MAASRLFPDPRRSTPEGIVAVGGDLEPETVLSAYRSGIFPWPHQGLPLLWFCPPRRAVLELSHIHVSRSLARARRRARFTFTADRAFGEVISACAAAKRPGQSATWITAGMREAYLRLHRLGWAHSVEAWSGDELAGGVYGVDAGGAFSAESMFHREPDASKLALLELADRLRRAGLEWMDIQVMTPHMRAMGAREVSRDEFLARLAKGLAARGGRALAL